MIFTLYLISQGYLLYLFVRPYKDQKESNEIVRGKFRGIPSVNTLKKEADHNA
jgi:hypothetical protein